MAEELGWVHNILEMGQRSDAYDPAATLKRESGDLLATRQCLHWQPCPLLKNACIGYESSRGSSVSKYLGDAFMGLGIQFN
jgi:hypothetical protein